MNAQLQETPTRIGQRVSYENQACARKYGTVCEILPEVPGMSTMIIGGGGLQPITHRYMVVYDDLGMSEGHDPVDGYQHRYADEPDKTPEECAELLRRAHEKQAADAEERRKQSDVATQKANEYRESIKDKIPTWAKSAIVACLEVDNCDMMTDYFNTTRQDFVILGFSKHTRDIFSEMRKFAGNIPETAHLSIPPTVDNNGQEKTEDNKSWWHPADEHREKHSMGVGYYLKEGLRYSTGWKIYKMDFYKGDPVQSIPTGAKWAVSTPKPTKAAKPSQSTAGPVQAHIEEHEHTKKGFTMYMVILDSSLERDEFNDMRDQVKAAGGWYSRKWGKTPGGFAFEAMEAAQSFLESITGPNNTPDSTPPKGRGEKFREMADNLAPKIEDKFRDRQTNTPKRLAQANGARFEGDRLKRTQTVLYALADMHDAGTVPENLQWVKTKAHVYDCMAEARDQVPNGYHSFVVGTGKPFEETPKALALWSLLTGKTEAEQKADELQRKVEGLQFSSIPGYFPTPDAVIDLMLDYADIKPEHLVLEPSAGSGAIADAVAPLCSSIECIESNYTLFEIIEGKGYRAYRGDFLEGCWTEYLSGYYDRIIMNPPFENLQDVEHVRHAFDCLKTGGRLVSVMSPSSFFNSTNKAKEFRAWFDEVGGEVYDLPDGSFKESGTGVGSKLIVIDK